MPRPVIGMILIAPPDDCHTGMIADLHWHTSGLHIH